MANLIYLFYPVVIVIEIKGNNFISLWEKKRKVVARLQIILKFNSELRIH